MSFVTREGTRYASGDYGRLLKRGLSILALLAILTAVYAAGGEYLDLGHLAAREHRLRIWLRDQPIRSFIACFLGYLVISLVPGTTGKSLVVAWFLGFWRALLIVNLALTIAATISLTISRHYFRDIVLQRWHSFATAADRALEHDGGWYVLLLRLLHVPFTIVNYTLGATSIRTSTFWWATQVGMLPGNVVFVYAGSQLPSLETLAEQGVHAFLTPQLMAAFVLLTVIPVVGRWCAMLVTRHRQSLR